MGSQGTARVFVGAGKDQAVRPLIKPKTLAKGSLCSAGRRSSVLPSALGSREEAVLAQDNHLAIRPLGVGDGLSHPGEPEEEEVIVVEEPESEDPGPKVVRVPRTPTQAEIIAHEATHVLHEEWCEFCMAGRARNKPHKSKNRTSEGPGEASEVPGAPSGPDAEDVQPGGPVPRICMDYFYVSSGGTDKRGAHGMSTKELQMRLKELGKSNEGQRNVLIKRYERCVA